MTGHSTASLAMGRATSDAVALSGVIRDVVSMGEERLVLMLRFSSLPPARRTGTQAELLRACWEPLLSTARIRSFKLPDGDLVAIALPNAAGALETHRQALFSMLEPEEAESAVRLLKLPFQAAAVLAAVEESLGLAAAMRALPRPDPGESQADATALAAAERALVTADLTAFLRRQRVCWLEPGGQMAKPLWEDRRVSLAEMRDTLMPGCDIERTPGIARRLQRAIDRRHLTDLSRPEELRDLRHISVPLSVDTLLSPEFQRFDSLLPSRQRGQVILSLQATDVLADAEKFRFAREFALARGHKLMLEAAGPLAALVLPAMKNGFSMLRLLWSEALPGTDSPAAAELRAKWPDPAKQVVLAGADRPAAIAWGWEAGIRMFQGRIIEGHRPPA